MVITNTALDHVDQHWAVSAINKDEKDRAFEIAKIRMVQSAVGRQMTIEFDEQPKDEELIRRVAMAYEVAAIEGLDSLLYPSGDNSQVTIREQAQAAAFRSYELRRTLQIPTEDEARIFHILHLSAIAYCGEQWPDLRRWLKDHDRDIKPPSVADVNWDYRILYRLFDCWIRLLRKQGWDDLDSVREIVAGLRKDQEEYEAAALSKNENDDTRAIAFRLIALYHWAKATELLAIYVLQGEPPGIEGELDKHFEAAIGAAISSQDAALDVLLRWLHLTARKMTSGSLWKVAQAVNSRVSRFVKSVTKKRSLFELLPPQRAALQEQGLLDQASRAIVIDLPTSGGKTTLAQFRILQALNQFDADKGWVAYVAPTRALVTQLTRRLREDFGPLNIKVEQLTGAVEIDSFEETLLTAQDDQMLFNILVATPEKLQLVIRNKKVSRPLALIVMDEAHNIEDDERGLRIELLLATIKRECSSANFLLLMPYVPNAHDLAQWLGGDSGRTISIGTSAWQPNERVVGIFHAEQEASVRGGWSLKFETLTTTPKTISFRGSHKVGPTRPLNVSFSKVKQGLSIQAGAMAKVFSERGTSIVVAQKITDAWSMARIISQNLELLSELPPEISLVQRFLQTEISPNFELVNMLSRGVGVHHAGLSDETRTLIEWLAEIGVLRVLCATTTIAQGINFPVTSVFLATRLYPYGKEMNTRAFWNLSGRAGRIKQESIGVVGLAAGKDPEAVKQYVSRATGDLISQLVNLLDEVETAGQLNNLRLVIQNPEWSEFRSYVAHLWSDKQNIDAVLAETEQLLRNTFGFGILQREKDESAKSKATALLDATRDYAYQIAKHPERAVLADATGFAPEGVAAAMIGLTELRSKIEPSDWQPESLFGKPDASFLPDLVGVMMHIPELSKSLKEIGSEGLNQKRIAGITRAWVDGASIQDIAESFFSGKTNTQAITNACRAIYRVLTNSGPWGLSALSRIGVNFENLSPEEKRKINSLPAMIYHGVKSEAGILMRMNSVPRSIAESLGSEFERRTGVLAGNQTVGVARDFLRSLNNTEWGRFAPKGAAMSGKDYQEIWSKLSGEILK